MKKIFCAILILSLGLPQMTADAQSKSFSLGKWTEIQSAILKELNYSYVDSLPVDKMERAGIDAMLDRLDPYTIYIPEEEIEDLELMISATYGGLGAVIYKPDTNGNVFITEPYYNSPAQKAGIVCGDEVLAIDGTSVIGLTTQECSDRMKGVPGSKVTLKVKKLRTSEVRDIKIVRERIHLPVVEYADMINDTTGYILQSQFTERVSQEVKRAVLKLKQNRNLKQIVLDLRGNGGGILDEAVEIVSIFVPKGSLVVSAKDKNGETVEYRTKSEPLDSEIPLIVLVDSGSASASEIVAGALQDMDRARIIGKRTFGKGLVQSIRPLPYNGQIKVTTAKYYTPSGRCVQAIDYSHRNEDGSVGYIPDSLTHEFRTAGGRIVKDGGGITPDVEIDAKSYSRLTYSLYVNGVFEQYALEYVRKHAVIPPVKEYHFDEYEDFIAFAKTKEFDYRSSARTYFDQMVKEIKRDGLEESMSAQIEAMKDALEMEKEEFLILKKDEIIPFIEEEIAVRYYFQEAGIEIRIRYDDQLWEALKS